MDHQQSSVLWAFGLEVHNEALTWNIFTRKIKICLFSCSILLSNHLSVSLNRKNICDNVLIKVDLFSRQYSWHDMASDPKNYQNDLENYQNFVSHSIIGVVGDVRREMSGHHYAEVLKSKPQGSRIYILISPWISPQICSVFGINGEELSTLQDQGLETRPKKYDAAVDRYQVWHQDVWIFRGWK